MLELFGTRLLVEAIREKNEVAEDLGIDVDDLPSCAWGKVVEVSRGMSLPVQVGDRILFTPGQAVERSDGLFVIDQTFVLGVDR